MSRGYAPSSVRSRVYEVKGIKIVVKRGDITEEDVDAIVNPANSLMIMGGGVAGAIKRKGGEEIEREAMKYAPVPVGDAIVTTAGRLKAKYVIHSPTMERPAMRIGIENVRKAARAALRKAEELGISSLAFPALGAGVGGVPAYESIKAILSEVLSANLRKVKEVRLIAWSQRDFEAFLKAVEEMVGE